MVVFDMYYVNVCEFFYFYMVESLICIDKINVELFDVNDEFVYWLNQLVFVSLFFFIGCIVFIKLQMGFSCGNLVGFVVVLLGDFDSLFLNCDCVCIFVKFCMCGCECVYICIFIGF